MTELDDVWKKLNGLTEKFDTLNYNLASWRGSIDADMITIKAEIHKLSNDVENVRERIRNIEIKAAVVIAIVTIIVNIAVYFIQRSITGG